MEQRIENSEVFRLTDDQSAEWAVRKIREARRDTEQWEAHFAGQMERIRKANEETEAYFTTLLPKWAELKKRCTIGPDGVVVDTETGVVLEGVRAEERPDKFEVKLRGEQDEP